MKCFIASAFGHEDVDVIYDSCVISTLRKLSVTPLRVDRIEHNEEIDNKIFELLGFSDFVIADLTYARPRVTEGMPYFYLQKTGTNSSGEHRSYHSKRTRKLKYTPLTGIKNGTAARRPILFNLPPLHSAVHLPHCEYEDLQTRVR